jgi:hypothetical protein
MPSILTLYHSLLALRPGKFGTEMLHWNKLKEQHFFPAENKLFPLIEQSWQGSVWQKITTDSGNILIVRYQ